MDKFFLRSKTIFGALILLINPLLALFGIEPLAADQVAGMGDQIVVVLDSLNEIVGLVLVVWGRVSAKSSLTLLPKIGEA